MSHNLEKIAESNIIAGCNLPGTLVPGSPYLFTGLSQGVLSFDVLAFAKDDTFLEENVTVFPLGENGWRGSIDWADCQLTFLEDNLANRIYGKANISDFPWGNVAFQRNFIDASSNLTFSGGNVVSFQGNTLVQGSSWDISNALTLTALNNYLSAGTILINQSGSDITFNNNRLEQVGTINLNPVVPAGATLPVVITDTQVSRGSTVTIANARRVLLDNSIIDSVSVYTDLSSTYVRTRGIRVLSQSIINFMAGLVGNGTPELVNYSVVLENSALVDFTGQHNATVTFNNLRIQNAGIVHVTGTYDTTLLVQNGTVESESTLNFQGSAVGANSFRRFFISNFSQVTVGNQGTNSELRVERGVLNTATFSANRIKLEDATSNLVANIIDAQKSGYVNALP